MEEQARLQLIKRVRLFLILLLFLAILWVVLSIHRSLSFRVSGTDPSVTSVATISPFFKIEFNKPLARTVSVTIYPQNLPASYEIKGSVVTVTFNKQLQEGQTYSVRLANIADQAGSHLPNKTFSFQAQSISPSALSASQQKVLEANQAKYNAIQNDGLVQLLPFSGGGNEFQVSYTINYSAKTPQLVIVVTASSPQGQTDAVNWIRQVGFDPSKYTITFLSPSNNE